ncbi:MAG: glycosyltransferase [Armatimonadetes bacterium]|nr:glycosyltransferase [Armatimonadota bacterium]
MKILQLVNAYGPRTGGVRTHVDQIRRAYAAQGHEPVLLIPGAQTASGADAAGALHTVASPRFFLNPDYRNVWNHRAVLSLVERIGPDVAEIIDKYTLPRLAPELERRGIPTLGFSSERLSEVLVPYVGGGALTQALVRRYNRWFAGRFRTVVSHSRFNALELQAVGAGNVQVVPLGVDLEAYHPARRDEALRRELLGGAEHLLLYVGRLVREKSVGLLAGLAARLAGRLRCRVVVAGGGPEEERLREAPGLTCLGFVADPVRRAALYASCDVFVFPSAVESFGLSVLEALASGARVVGATRGAVAEVVPEGAGILAEPSVEAFASAVEAALALDPVEAARVARRRAEEYPWSAVAERLLALHQTGLRP